MKEISSSTGTTSKSARFGLKLFNKNPALLEMVPLFIILFMFSSCNQQSQPQTHAQTTIQPAVTVAPQIVDRIILTNGGSIEGKIVSETPEMIRIEWEGSVVGFQRNEIQSVERGTAQTAEGGLQVPTFQSEEEKKEAWPAGADHRILLKNGEWINGTIVDKKDNAFVVKQKFEEGGSIEIEINLDRVEKIQLWKPSEADHQTRLSEFLQRYPHMKLLQKGYYTILSSETDPADLKFYLKTLEQFYSDFLVHFFGLFELDRTLDPLDVLIFGTQQEFKKILAEVGYHARSNPIGFYHFHAKKLVFYNVRSDTEVQSALKEIHEYQSDIAQLKETGEAEQYGGQVEQASESASREELRLLGKVTAQNVKVIRHEGGHQLFHLTGVTPIEVYAGGWLIEGLAVYCETDPIGTPHEERLMQLRFELERSELMPLEYLLHFKRGTELHQLDPLYANLAYAESWAFVYFLMQNYRDPFFHFLKEMRVQNETFDSQGELVLLEKHLGKDLKTIEQEFSPFVKDLIARYTDDKTYQDYRLRLISAT